MKIHKITILPENVKFEIEENTNLLDAIRKNSIPIKSVCGGEGICGSCKVIIKSADKNSYTTKPSQFISNEETSQGYVLACQTTITGDLQIEIPEESRIEEIQSVEILPIAAFQQNKFSYEPLGMKLHLKLPPPADTDNTSDFERLQRQIDNEFKKIVGTLSGIIIKANLKILQYLPKLLRKSDFDVTVSIVEQKDNLDKPTFEIVKIEPYDTSQNAYGIALDIGTTTVVAYLLNLASRDVLSAKATYNRQMSFGEDIISRIIYTEEENGAGLRKLNQLICNTINDLIDSLVREAKISPDDILCVQVAGNTTMIHLFLGLPPENIRKEPYVPVVSNPPVVYASELGIKIHPRGSISCMPAIASYVGGDIVAGVLACGMENSQTTTLLIDLGTNGEIVLGNKDWLICAACSAGPAFEGVGIKCGIRAVSGAIQKIHIDVKDNSAEIKYTTIDNKKPRGICGSGLIDIPAELLLKKVIDRSGKFVKDSPLCEKRLRKNIDNEYEFVIVEKDKTSTGKDIVITEGDIANLIRSKGAVFMGIQVLLQEVGLKFENINQIYIAGGFGTFLDIEKAIIIGLLPDLNRDKFSFIGNSSITGAKICLLSREARQKAMQIGTKMTYIDLSTNTKFMNEYTSTLFLPHTNINIFPTVKKLL
ncbi:MAG: ASKHA domain-containing protein [Elusimicrobiota bacterium]|nr:ASKHA domain-containing protein [Elusimicrobiota bacterium]